jgi:hypothetical protein
MKKSPFLLSALLVLAGLLSSCVVVQDPGRTNAALGPGALESLFHAIMETRAETGEWPESLQQMVEIGTINRNAWWINLAEIQEVQVWEDETVADYEIFIEDHQHGARFHPRQFYEIRLVGP